jgi:S-adenosyl-L-methionine hydrolase (adenosine-forming)
MTIITLTTDFGIQDEYVGVLKGVICGIDSHARVIDITHHIPAHDVVGAAYVLKSAFACFPAGSVHAAVVDPGVGTSRAIVAARLADHMFIAPDNGLLAPLIDTYGVDELIRVQNRTFFREPLSRTFHGRDIFAPVAAHLSKGVALREFGPPLEPGRLKSLNFPPPRLNADGRLEGHVVWVDRFGNLITDIHSGLIMTLAHTGEAELFVNAGGMTLRGLVSSYTQGAQNEPVAIIGSRDCLEIAVNQGSAQKVLSMGTGAPVHVFTEPKPMMRSS